MIAGLPYDAEVEYLESTGTQYINIGDAHDFRESMFVLRAMQTANYGTEPAILGSQEHSRFELYLQNEKIRFWSGGSLWTPDTVSFPKNQICDVTLSINSSSATVTSSGQTSTASGTSSITGVEHLQLFAYRTTYLFTGRIYFAKVYVSSALMLDLIPVRFTNELGQSEGAMYDRVSRKLFRNAGTGSFTIGPDVATPVMGLHFFKSQIKTAKDYVQNGLIAMWDGIENVGYGQHDDNATSWADLTGKGANWLLKDSHTTQVFEVGSDYVKILSEISYGGRGYCSPSWASVDDLVSCEIVFDADNVDMTTITNARRVVGFTVSGTGTRSIWLQSGFINCGYNQYPCAAITQGAYSMSFDFGVQRAMLNGAFFESTRKGLGWIGMPGPSISGYGYGDAYCAVGAKIKALRIYGRSPTDAERLANYTVDKVRFNLP